MAFNYGTGASLVITIIATYILVQMLTPGCIRIFIATIAGLVGGFLIGLVTEYYTSYDHKPTRSIVKAAETGAATDRIAGIAVGMILGVTALAGMFVGSISSGFLVAVFMANAGGAWDNTKKYIEHGHSGGKGSAAHKAAVTGDTVGDPFKYTAGPALNILLKLMAVVSVIFAPIFL
jgi:Na+/H+-translocating membrane pyrophosphatase